MENLADKTAIITGGASGIGRATAMTLARCGANVVVADIHENGKEVAAWINAHGGMAKAIVCDVANAGEVEAMVSKTVAMFGALHIAVNSAGVEGMHAGTIEHTEEMWDKVLDINLKAVWLCMKYELMEIRKQQDGCIVNVSSAAGLVAGTGTIAYTASKHGVVGLTKAAALEYAPQGVRINAVCPGFVRTPMLEKLFAAYPGVESQLSAREPVKRLANAEEVAQAICFLCSGASSFLTGVVMPIDGGLTLGGA